MGANADGCGQLRDQTDDALRDRVEVVVVRWTHRVVQRSTVAAAELFEAMRHELAFAVGVESTDAGARQGATLGVDASANCGVERCEAAIHRRHDLGLLLDEVVEHEARVLVYQEDNVSVVADGEHHLLEVKVEDARLRSGGGQRPGVALLLDARLSAAVTWRSSRRRREDLGSVGGGVRHSSDLVDA